MRVKDLINYLMCIDGQMEIRLDGEMSGEAGNLSYAIELTEFKVVYLQEGKPLYKKERSNEFNQPILLIDVP